MARSVPEWIGKTADSVPPRTVRARVFAAHGGRCWISGRQIGPADKWDLDHRVALCNGGENREANLAPALRDRHREKTARDVDEHAKTERTRAKHFGYYPKSKARIRSRGFDRSRPAVDGQP